MPRRSTDRTRRLTLCGLLLALMLVLGYVEHLIPVTATVPGVKLGLSNSVLIFAVYMLDIPTTFVLMALKVVLAGFLYSGVNAMLYAFAGGLLSVTCMVLLSRVKGMHTVTVSMMGGVMHNVGQVLMAMLMLQTYRLMYYLAILIFSGLACGALTGVCAHQVMKHLRHVRR